MKVFSRVALLVVWPFVWLWPYVTNIGGQYIRIGNDFNLCYYRYKLYVLDFLSRFQIPLWAPSEAAGYPVYSNPFAQVFYPLNIVLAAYYRWNGGYQVLDHQRFTVFAFSILGVGLYFWLRSLKFEDHPALVTALVMTLSFKATELLRFPNAIHTAAWYPWLLFAVTKIAFEKSNTSKLLYSAVLCAASICFITGGYPYYGYYGIFLFGPYLAWLFTKQQDGKRGRSVAFIALGFLSALLVTLPYILSIQSLVNETVNRAGRDFAFSSGAVFGFVDSLGSFLYPPAAGFEGWFYFGITGFVLTALFLVFSKNKTGFFLFAWFLVIGLVAHGGRSPVFSFLWHTMPFFSHLQVWGRLNIILVPIFSWLMVMSLSFFEKQVHLDGALKGGLKKETVFKSAFLLFLPILAVQLIFFFRGVEDSYWMIHFVTKFADGFEISKEALSQGLKATFILSSFVSFIFFVFLKKRKLFPYLVFLCIAISELVMIGPWIWCARRSELEPKQNIAMQNQFMESFQRPRIDIYSTVMHDATFNVGTIWNWHFDRYLEFRKRFESHLDQEAVFQRFMGVLDGKKVFLSKTLQHDSLISFLKESDGFGGNTIPVSYNGDTLVLDCVLIADGYVSFIDNYQKGWVVEVDGMVAPLEILFGTFKSVAVPAGAHQVIFRYRPSFFQH